MPAALLDEEPARLEMRWACLADFELDEVPFLESADVGSSASGEGRLCEPIVSSYLWECELRCCGCDETDDRPLWCKSRYVRWDERDSDVVI